MRVRTVVAAVLAGSTFAAAQPADLPQPEEQPPPLVTEAPPPPEAPPAEPPAPAPAPPVTVTGPPGALPPITITITNNNTGNNSNTNTQTNSQANPQTNTQSNAQTNTQTNTAPVTVTTSVGGPGTVAPIASPPRGLVGHYELITPRARGDKWITLGFSRSGVRASIDLLGRGPFTIGVAATAGGAEHHEREEHPDGGVVAYLAWTRKLGRLEVRASFGLGVGSGGGGERHGGRRGRDDDDDDDIAARSTTGGTTTDPTDDDDRHGHGRFGMRAEAALLVGLPLTKHLGLLAGPVISATGGGDHADGGKGHEHGEGDVNAAVMAGLRYQF